ncbi:hypothetical protein QZH41_011612 [Actinostola sp. cb2023]|nr:hypothetical protein QZH41_011612 [Actinostola sp. cb2023]
METGELEKRVETLTVLAAAKAINDHRALRKNVAYLPRTVLESLMTSSIRQGKILALRELLCHWPFKQLILHDFGEGFEELHAVLFAFTLQKSESNLELIDIRGCRTGFHGTSAFCKLAVGLPVSQNDVSAMTVIDSRSLMQVEQSMGYLTARVPPLTVILDCYVNLDNHQLMKQALVKHSILDIKACKMSLVELGKRKICSLISFLEVQYKIEQILY